MLHLYKLIVEFTKRERWDLDILAEDISWLPLFLPLDKTNITSVHMTLVTPNKQKGTGAKTVTD